MQANRSCLNGVCTDSALSLHGIIALFGAHHFWSILLTIYDATQKDPPPVIASNSNNPSIALAIPLSTMVSGQGMLGPISIWGLPH